MRRNAIAAFLCILCPLLSACAPGETEPTIIDEIRAAPVVKLECAQSENSEPIFADNVGTTASIADMRLQPSDGTWNEAWIYRFTYNPDEKVRDGHAIVILFGSASMSVDGIPYIPEDGVAYDTILEWAEGVYSAFAEA